jgi:hypothetical protein
MLVSVCLSCLGSSMFLVSPSANLIIRVRDHTSASSGAGPMELVSMACPSVVRGRIIIIMPWQQYVWFSAVTLCS